MFYVTAAIALACFGLFYLLIAMAVLQPFAHFWFAKKELRRLSYWVLGVYLGGLALFSALCALTPNTEELRALLGSEFHVGLGMIWGFLVVLTTPTSLLFSAVGYYGGTLFRSDKNATPTAGGS
ncbi:hypothetical protein SAMN04488036_101789 [Shimia haliotis]|uniref:Uncharacterized protein n=2 Tax=Shimia haliotis TaxID=1280847 RepID=A0A1I4B6A8_9RHOB|nr:hypothetical protein SAMN04488036_101789 [Shimia haliotis]